MLLGGLAIYGSVTLLSKRINSWLNQDSESQSFESLFEDHKTRAMEQQILMKQDYERSVVVNENSKNGLIILNAVLKTVDKNETGDGDFDGRILEDSESESEDVFITEKDSGAWIGAGENSDNVSMDCTIPVQLRVSEGQFSLNLWNLKYQPGFYDPSNGDKSKTLVLTITERY